MREIEGFLCVGKSGHESLLFGPSSKPESHGFQTFKANGLVPFPSLREAELAKEKIISLYKQFSSVHLISIKMSLLEEKGESETFKGEQNFIVVADRGEAGAYLIGQYMSGIAINTCGGSPFEDNGLTPFSDLDDALWTVSEAARQLECPATLARIDCLFISR